MKKGTNFQSLSLEDVYQRADTFIDFYIFFYGILSFVLSTIYNTWTFTVYFNAFVLFIYLFFRLGISNPLYLRAVSAMIIILYPALFIYQMQGYPLMHMFYVLSAFILVIYQNFKFVVLGFLPGLLHYAYYIYLHLKGEDIRKSFLDVPEIHTDLLIVFGCFMPLLVVITNFFITKSLRETTLRNLDFIRHIDEQNLLNEKNKNFANEIAKGNFEVAYQLSDKDKLGEALMQMRESLKQADQKDYHEKFYNTGLAEISEILRIYAEDIQQFSQKIISKIVKYIGANTGGIFIYTEERYTSNTYLELKACYAFDFDTYSRKKIMSGEGLVGQVFQNKKTIVLDDIPENYFNISSGLGSAKPSSLVFIPLKNNEMIEGVMEISAMNPIEPFKINLLEKLAESIALAIASAKLNNNTRLLLRESQEQAEIMQAQEEEMRQNMEELITTQESMKQKQAEIEKMNQKMEANEMILKKALEKNKESEKRMQDKIAELEQTKAAIEEMKQSEATRFQEQIEARNKIMEKKLEQFKKNEIELREKIKTQEEENQKLNKLIEELKLQAKDKMV